MYRKTITKFHPENILDQVSDQYNHALYARQWHNCQQLGVAAFTNTAQVGLVESMMSHIFGDLLNKCYWRVFKLAVLSTGWKEGHACSVNGFINWFGDCYKIQETAKLESPNKAHNYTISSILSLNNNFPTVLYTWQCCAVSDLTICFITIIKFVSTNWGEPSCMMCRYHSLNLIGMTMKMTTLQAFCITLYGCLCLCYMLSVNVTDTDRSTMVKLVYTVVEVIILEQF